MAFIDNPPVPSSHMIPGRLEEGKVINIIGTPNHGASRFTVNLLSGSDIALHFEARFDGSDKNAVITNERVNGRWGVGKREFFAFNFPFPIGKRFDMAINVNWSGFEVFVNGKKLLWTFHQIKPLSKIEVLRVEGDVAISQIRVQ